MRANVRVNLKTDQYGKTASKKINLSSISCCVLCEGENAYLVYKNETTQFQHQEKPFECRNCPRGYFLRKVFILINLEFRRHLKIFENRWRETKQIEVYGEIRREFERYACCNENECICDTSNCSKCPTNYYRPRQEAEKCCHESTIYKNGECLQKTQSLPSVPPTVTRTVPPTTKKPPPPHCKGNC